MGAMSVDAVIRAEQTCVDFEGCKTGSRPSWNRLWRSFSSPADQQLLAFPFLMRSQKVATGRITWIDDHSDIMSTGTHIVTPPRVW